MKESITQELDKLIEKFQEGRSYQGEEVKAMIEASKSDLDSREDLDNKDDTQAPHDNRQNRV